MISIVVPVYNAERSIHKCIDSIVNQTFEDLEIILVNDGSKDNSGLICDEYAKKDNRIKVVHKENGGVSSARNSGLDIMTGQYFCFIDSDDYIEKDMIEKLYKAISESGAEIAICGYKRFCNNEIKCHYENKGDIVGKIGIADFVAKNCLNWLVSTPWAKLYTTTYLSNVRFDESMSLGEDTKFNLNFFEYIEKITIVDECLYCYVDTEGSLTNTYKEGYFDAICKLYKVVAEFIQNHSVNGKKIYININYKIFFYSYKFINANIERTGFIQQIKFINQICRSSLLQKAVQNLPPLSLYEKLYAWGLRKRLALYLWGLSIICLNRCKYLQSRKNH